MPTDPGKIIWTEIDEAPALATFSLLPIIRKFTGGTGITIETADISLAGRILANFPEGLTPAQRVPDWLTRLGELAKRPEANIVKLPNISASVPQLKAAIRELQKQGYNVPDYPENPAGPAEQAIKTRYAKVLGSAVNPVLREGNSDRRAAGAVKEYARKHPHKLGPWKPDSKAHVATMGRGDFASNEKSVTVRDATMVRIEFTDKKGAVTVLKDRIALKAGEVIDGTFMSSAALVSFLEQQIEESKRQGVLFSIHLKATMMKISDPIIFGYAVRTFFRDVFDKHAVAFKEVGVDPNNGLGDLYAAIKKLPPAALSRGHRARPAARRFRPEHHGHRAERRADGPAGRGVRLSRQDRPDAGRRNRAHRRRARHDPDRARGAAGRHLARLSGEGRA